MAEVRTSSGPRFHTLLIEILAEHGNIDLWAFARIPRGETLLAELKVAQDWRNGVLHRGEGASAEQAATAVAVATTFLDKIQPALLGALGLHAHGRGVVCLDQGWQCREREKVGERD